MTRAASSARRVRSAELLAVGSELTNGETRDSNGGELAASLASAGVAVRRIAALPDDLALVTAHFREALAAVDLVVSTGGLGPTPDDLTREALAATLGQEPRIDPALEAWLREKFARRGTRMPENMLKQAWLIPAAVAIPNDNGTAPGWWVEGPDGALAILLPGPPREMRPMWRDWVLPRLRDRGLGDGRLVRTLRTYGIGESLVVERLGERMLRAPNPIVATYARPDWLDIRISAVDERLPDGRPGRPAAEILATTDAAIRDALPGHVRAEGETTWADLVADALAAAGCRIATIEAGTGGQLAALLTGVAQLERSVVLAGAGADLRTKLGAAASDAAAAGESELGMALVAEEDGPHTAVAVALVAPGRDWSRALELTLFQHGAQGRLRAAVAAAAFLVDTLGGDPSPGSHENRRE